MAQTSTFEAASVGESKVVRGGVAWVDEKQGFPVPGERDVRNEMGVRNDLPSYGQVMKGV